MSVLEDVTSSLSYVQLKTPAENSTDVSGCPTGNIADVQFSSNEAMPIYTTTHADSIFHTINYPSLETSLLSFQNDIPSTADSMTNYSYPTGYTGYQPIEYPHHHSSDWDRFLVNQYQSDGESTQSSPSSHLSSSLFFPEESIHMDAYQDYVTGGQQNDTQQYPHTEKDWNEVIPSQTTTRCSTTANSDESSIGLSFEPSAYIANIQGHLYPYDPDGLRGDADGSASKQWNTTNNKLVYPHRESKKGQRSERLWEFIRSLLLSPKFNPSLAEWVDRRHGLFRFNQSKAVAQLWGSRKNNENMTYEKLSRAMRYYYSRKILLPVIGKKLVYKFGPNSHGW